MATAQDIIAEILADVNLIAELYPKIAANVAAAKDALASNPDATMAEQLATAQSKLAAIQADAAKTDAAFDAALAASQAG